MKSRMPELGTYGSVGDIPSYIHDVAKEERKLKWTIIIFIWTTFLLVTIERH